MRKIYIFLSFLPYLCYSQLTTPNAQLQSTSNPTTGNIGIGTNSPLSKLDIVTNGSIPIIRGTGGYIPTGLRFIDDSYTQPGQVKEWSIWKGNGWLKGLGFMRYDVVGCQGGICDVPLFLSDSGKIGIGTVTPQTRLEVFGNVGEGQLTLSTNDNISNDLSRIAIDFKISNQNQIISRISSYYADSSNGGTGGLRFFTKLNGNLLEQMKISENGNVSISNKLEANEIKVTTSPTADFVFEENYNLPKLEDVEKHIKEKKHLPEIASAKEMEANGVNVGEFQIKLLQKIEELTLYTIEQNKQLQKLQTENKELKAQQSLIEKLNKRLTELEKR